MTRWATTDIIRETAEDRMTAALAAWVEMHRKAAPQITDADIQFMRRTKNRAPSRMPMTQESKERVVQQREVV